MLRVHRGLFLSTGVYGWNRLTHLMYALKKDPEFVHETAFELPVARQIDSERRTRKEEERQDRRSQNMPFHRDFLL